VLVVGAGPVGLTLACELERHGVACRIVDMNEGPSLWSKAAVVHARTLEALDAMGLASRAVARGRKIHALGFFSGAERIGQVSVDGLDSPFPFMLGLSQRETELLLDERLVELGGAVDRGVELTSIDQAADHVRASLLHVDGRRETVRASWVCGCDGAHSAVRKALEIPFDGSSYEECVLQADVRIRWPSPMRDDEGLFFGSSQGAIAALPVLAEGRYRLIVMLGPDEAYDP
jgi:2-polyprenyl-6-methoxyphenol hydroxylase-like FAD-dependent oxidoreductase